MPLRLEILQCRSNSQMHVYEHILTKSLLLITARLKNSIGDDADSDQKLQGVVESIPMKRVTQPQDVANAAWYLGSGESSFVTGTTLEVDGGRGV